MYDENKRIYILYRYYYYYIENVENIHLSRANDTYNIILKTRSRL